MVPGDRRRAVRRALIAVAVSTLVLTIACWPTSRFVGINFVVTEHTLPLWTKAVDFIDRDLNLARTTQAVLGGSANDDARAAAALAWTRANIRPRPDSLPVIDDHVWHIIVRGYGQRDQMADVFTTLLSYSGVRAYWTLIGDPPDELALSYVWIREQWRVYDVANGVTFRNRQGDLATPAELAADPGLIRAAAMHAELDDLDATSHISPCSGRPRSRRCRAPICRCRGAACGMKRAA